MTAPIRVAIIGCGDIAQKGHLPALLAHPSFELVGLCDVRADRLELLGSMAPAAQRTSDYRSLIPRADAFILALHPEVSVPIAIDLLDQGKHVLDEKPLAVSPDAGRLLQLAVKRASSIYQIGFVFRYCEFALKVADMVRQLQSPASVSIRLFDERLDPADAEHRARIDEALGNSSAITHEGSHFIDMATLWNPSGFTSVEAVATRTIQSLPGPNLWHAVMRHEDGGLLHLEIGWLLPDNPPSTLQAVGPAGWLHAPLAGGDAVLHLQGRSRNVPLPAMRQNWQQQLTLFADAVQTGAPRGATFDHGWHALITTVACEAAARIVPAGSHQPITGASPTP
jgi:predicted dehydrogenase